MEHLEVLVIKFLQNLPLRIVGILVLVIRMTNGLATCTRNYLAKMPMRYQCRNFFKALVSGRRAWTKILRSEPLEGCKEVQMVNSQTMTWLES